MIKKKVSEARKTIYHSWEEVPTPLPNKKAYAVDKASEKKKPVSVKKAPWDKKEETTKESSSAPSNNSSDPLDYRPNSQGKLPRKKSVKGKIGNRKLSGKKYGGDLPPWNKKDSSPVKK